MVASRHLPTQPAKADWSSKWLTKPKSRAAKLPLKPPQRLKPLRKGAAVVVAVVAMNVVVVAVMAAVAAVVMTVELRRGW